MKGLNSRIDGGLLMLVIYMPEGLNFSKKCAN